MEFRNRDPGPDNISRSEKKEDIFERNDRVKLTKEFVAGDGERYPIGASGTYLMPYSRGREDSKHLAYVEMDGPPKALVLVMTDELERESAKDSHP